MIDQKLIDRINFLANKKKNSGLTDEELKEQQKLRSEYLKQFREGFRQQLDSIVIEKETSNNEND